MVSETNISKSHTGIPKEINIRNGHASLIISTPEVFKKGVVYQYTDSTIASGQCWC